MIRFKDFEKTVKVIRNYLNGDLMESGEEIIVLNADDIEDGIIKETAFEPTECKIKFVGINVKEFHHILSQKKYDNSHFEFDNKEIIINDENAIIQFEFEVVCGDEVEKITIEKETKFSY